MPIDLIRPLAELLDAQGELPVNALVAATREPQPTVSQHLTSMKLRGLLKARRQGGQMFYSIGHQRVPKVLDRVRNCDVDPDGKEEG